MVGVAASGASASTILATGVAGTVAGAMSMAAGEYVSVQTQADTEDADLAMEKRELHEDPHSELEELAGIYRHRGLDPALARQVAEQLTAHDALGRTPATNWASPIPCARARCRRRWLRLEPSPAAPRCRC